jgi:hypothetical protein
MSRRGIRPHPNLLFKKQNRAAPNVILLFLVATLCVTLNCRQKTAPAISNAPANNDYLDLTTGHDLNITVPYFSSGGYTVHAHSVKEEGGTVTISNSHLVGFQVSHYAVEGHADGKVRLRFRSAETTRDGKSESEERKPALPFTLPAGSNYARLIYFVRSSRADHNMAIVAAKGRVDVNAFTSRLIADPGVCGRVSTVFCVWVPSGIAVRQE